MFRKLIIATGATVAIAAAALVPTIASAAPHGHHGHHGYHGWGRGISVGFYAPSYAYAGPECYVVRKVVFTPYGKRWRRVTVCD